MPMPTGVNPSYSYPQGYPQTTIPADIFRESLQTAALNKIRYRFDETIQVGNAEIESLKKAEQDLTNGEKKLQSIINDLQQQQIRAQVYLFIFSFYSIISFLFLELYHKSKCEKE
jgi:FtsZ-binding cell division protein ZapB